MATLQVNPAIGPGVTTVHDGEVYGAGDTVDVTAKAAKELKALTYYGEPVWIDAPKAKG